MGVVTDPIADMLARINNGCRARHTSIDVPVSKMKMAVAKILHREGYVRGFQLVNAGSRLRIRLKYDDRHHPVIAGTKRVSRPGRRTYAGKDKLPRVLGGIGVVIVSTSEGVMTAEEARKRGLGGEVICQVW